RPRGRGFDDAFSEAGPMNGGSSVLASLIESSLSCRRADCVVRLSGPESGAPLVRTDRSYPLRCDTRRLRSDLMDKIAHSAGRRPPNREGDDTVRVTRKVLPWPVVRDPRSPYSRCAASIRIGAGLHSARSASALPSRAGGDLLHEPSVAHDERLTCQGIRPEACKEQGGLRHIIRCRELSIDRIPEHHVLDDLGFGNAEFLRLLRDLLVHQGGPHEAGTNDIRSNAVARALLGDHFRETNQAMLRRYVGRFEGGRLLGMDRSHIDHASTTAASIHLAKGRPRRQERAIEVDGEKVPPLRKIEFLQRRNSLNARVAH